MESDWTTFFNFCKKSFIFQVSFVLVSEIVKILHNFYPILFSDTYILDKRFVTIRIIYHIMCRSCKKVVFGLKYKCHILTDLLTGLLIPY